MADINIINNKSSLYSLSPGLPTIQLIICSKYLLLYCTKVLDYHFCLCFLHHDIQQHRKRKLNINKHVGMTGLLFLPSPYRAVNTARPELGFQMVRMDVVDPPY
ncbi:hypothetical protein R5R35_008996 [Gryllus longicercus]|uniref:Uncharacterized protein n=1 Tax=Gryllus longicercus TaxID=2509291 RepID=A0AAN9VCU7_9ORTH